MKQLDKVEIGKMRQLAELLEDVPVDKFTLWKWQAQEETPAKTMLFGLIKIKPACGFAGCAMGWAAHSKLFDGLTIKHDTLLYKKNDSVFAHFMAAAEAMGITSKVASYLFDPDFYQEGVNGPMNVALRLYKFADKVESRLKRARYRYVKPIELSEYKLRVA